MKRFVLLAVLAAFTAGAVLAVRLLPWWALLLGFLLLVLTGKLVIGWLIRKLFLMPFRAKGAVLKGASAQVHKVSPAAASPTEVPADVSPASKHYLVEVTIRPDMPDKPEGPFRMWEPGELRLVRPESVLHPESDEADDEDSVCTVTKIQVEDEGRWTDDEGMKFGGPQKLRLHLAAEPGVRALKFRYYFEEFGSVRLP